MGCVVFSALRAEAVKEKKKNLVYSRPDFVNGFLAENRIRPLKKVLFRGFKYYM